MRFSILKPFFSKGEGALDNSLLGKKEVTEMFSQEMKRDMGEGKSTG